MKKTFTFALALAIAAPMMADNLQILKCTEDEIPGQSPLEPQLMGFSISANGRYVCGTIQQGSGLFTADCQTGEVKWTMGGEAGGELRGISNQGVAIGFADTGVLYSFDSGEESPLIAPEGIRYILGEGISNDGTVMVGSFTAQSFNTEAAYCAGNDGWKNLPLPSDEEKGNLKDHLNAISAAKYVSADGSVIFGHLGSFTFPIVWTRNDAGEYVADFYPERYIKAVEADRYDESKPLYGLSGMYLCMSNNGRYVGAVGQIANEDNTAKRLVPVIYDTKEKSLKIYSQPQDIDPAEVGLFPRAIADDGTFIGTIDETASSANMGCFIWRAGEEQAELYVDAFPEFSAKLGEADSYGQNIPTGISADGNHLLGYMFFSTDYDITTDDPAYYLTYVITLDDSGVDQVAGASAAPEAIYSIDGRKLSRLQPGLNIIRHSDGSTTKIYGERSF